MRKGIVETDRDGAPWVAKYEDMTRTERNKYIGEERVGVCADESNEMLRGRQGGKYVRRICARPEMHT